MEENLNNTLTPMIDALLHNRGLQYLSDLASEILGNPFWVIDMNYNYLTKPLGTISDKNILDEIQRGYVLDETVLSLRKNKTREIVDRQNEAYSFLAHGIDKHMIMAAVKTQNITIAYINVFEENKAFTPYDLQLMNTLALIFANELQKSSYFRNNKGIMYSYLLTDLLKSKLYTTQKLEKRLQALGYQLKEHFYILTVELSHTESLEIHVNAINEQIKFIFTNCIYCFYENHSVFLISKNKQLKPSTMEMQKLGDYLNTCNLKAAISEEFTDIHLTQQYYKKSLDALRLGAKVQPGQYLYYYSDLVIAHVIACCSPTIHYDELCGGAIKKLLLYDKQKQTNYLQTLYLYLFHNCQIPVTAKELHMHENTLRYRIAKIKELIDQPLEDGRQIMEFMLGYEMYNYSLLH